MDDIVRIALFVSRNKDNKEIPDFKERREAFIIDTYGPRHDLDIEINRMHKKFNEFVSRGVLGETCRLYLSVNNRNREKIKKNFIIELLKNDDYNLSNIKDILVSVAMKKENAVTKYWLIDYDREDSEEKVREFIEDMKELTNYKEYPFDILNIIPTVHGWHIIISHGFDTRELLKKYGDFVSIQKDAMLLVSRGARN
jgi:hypothetical protein